jgi:O-antigen ligase
LDEITTIPLATGLPEGRHTVTVTAQVCGGGWWLADWRVTREQDDTIYHGALVGLGILALLFAVGAFLSARRAGGGTLGQTEKAQIALARAATILRTSAWSVWYERVVAGFSSLGDTIAITATLAAATVFYFSPYLPLTLVSGLALAALVILRLDLGLALVAATAPFYLYPRPLFGKAFSMAEITTLLCLLSWGLHQLTNQPTNQPANRPLSSLDRAVLFFVIVAIASLFIADHRHVALRELRVVILEPALFYLMLRTSRLDGQALWRIVDALVLGAVAVALIGLVQYGFGINVITAEEGFRRLRSVYGSPNNAGLYLGRVLPVLVAVTLFGRNRLRRLVYGLAIGPVGLAVLFSFSKGALFLGVPLSLLALGVLAGGAWLRAALGAVAVAAVAAIPLLRTPRFASLFDTSGGTTFLRRQLWHSSWRMFREHPWLGVGPDNFLYHYRSRYVLPAAWEEPNLSHPHNILLDYATRMGIAGLAAGVWLQVAFWRLALPLRRLTDSDRRALALGLMASMVNFLAHGLVDASYFLIDLAFNFFLTLALIQHLARSKTNELET